MPRTARASVGDMCCHVINRGNGRATVFHKAADSDAFVTLLARASARLPMRLLAYCLVPNHFHLVLWPLGDGDLGRWMQWPLTAHVRRYHQHYRTSGHVWRGRFKAFPVQDDAHLWTVLRYVERNPLRAGLVSRAEDWPWSSLCAPFSAWVLRLPPSTRGMYQKEPPRKLGHDGQEGRQQAAGRAIPGPGWPRGPHARRFSPRVCFTSGPEPHTPVRIQ